MIQRVNKIKKQIGEEVILITERTIISDLYIFAMIIDKSLHHFDIDDYDTIVDSIISYFSF